MDLLSIYKKIKEVLESHDLLTYIDCPNDYIHHSKRTTHDFFIWIGTKDGKIGNERCHYEVISLELEDKKPNYDKKSDKVFVDVHFEDYCANSFQKLDPQHSYDWGDNQVAIRLNQSGNDMSDPDIVNKVIADLEKTEETYGDRIRRELENMKKEEFSHLIEANHNVIFYGAPGTGKTFLAKEIAKQIVGKGNEKTNIGFVQFHQSYDYTDFVEGLRPTKPATDGSVGFMMVNGVFKQFCISALEALKNAPDENDAPKYVFIIDEINRGEPAKIFGELFYSIDPGYRVKKKDLTGDLFAIRTQYANIYDSPNPFDEALGFKKDDEEPGLEPRRKFGRFFVPNNVYVIGTMNDIDRSVESIDFAFRRRFTWVEIRAKDTQSEILDSLKKPEWGELAKRVMNSLNDSIWKDKEGENGAEVGDEGIEGLSSSYHIGAAYFKKLNELDGDFNRLWIFHLEPLLREYLRGLDDADGKLAKLKQAYYDEADRK